ncbi:MAG: hypothetical protein JO354_12255 [Verrucomicrobia bacterium]|nr:hypothetical protein [Verrucomicrobiota bacterium]
MKKSFLAFSFLLFAFASAGSAQTLTRAEESLRLQSAAQNNHADDAAASITRDAGDTNGPEERARRGPEDTAPILTLPRLTIRARSVPAIRSSSTSTNKSTSARQASVTPSLAITRPAWAPIGPTPIPNGQTDPADANGISLTQNPVSGRTTAVAIHPTNPNITYVGTAQGGLYRTLDGGNTWTQLLDNAATNAVGSVRIDPVDPTKVIVGTGEGNFSGDSYIGKGVYLISGADGSSPVLNGPFNSDGAGHDVIANRCAVGLAIDTQNDNNVFVGTVTGIQGLYGVLPGSLPRRGLFRSTNFMSGSPTWQKLAVKGEDVTTSASDYRVTAVVVEPGNANNLLCAIASPTGAAEAGIYRSTNALAANPTFAKVFDLSDSTNSSFAPVRMAIQKNATTGAVTVVACAGYLNNTTSTTYNEGRAYKSTDGGQTWNEMTGARGFAGGQGFYNLGIDIDQQNPNNIYVVGTLSAQTQAGQVDTGDNGTFIYTRDGGATWAANPYGMHVDSHMVGVSASNPQVIYTGNDGGVWRSNDAGASWNDVNTSTYSATQFQSVALHPHDRYFALGGTQDNGTEFMNALGQWKRADFGDGGFALIDQSATDTENVTMYHTYYNAKQTLIGFARVKKASCVTEGQWAFRGAAVGVLPGGSLPIVLPVVGSTVCDGSNGQAANGILLTDDVNFYAPMALGPPVTGSQGDVLYFGTDKLYRSIDQGDTMVPVSSVLEPNSTAINPADIKMPGAPAVGLPANTPISAIAISPQDDNVRLVGTNSGNLYATTVGGPLIIVTQTGMPAQPVARVKIDPNNKTTAYATFVGSGFGGTNHVWKTTNLGPAGTTWTAMGSGLPDSSVNGFVIDPRNSNHLYAGTDNGVYNSTDGGATWSQYGTGLPPVAVYDLGIQDDFRVLRAATHGRGYYEITPVIGPVVPVSVVSRKQHGTAGAFDVSLPLTGKEGVECRVAGHLPNGATGDFQLVFTFSVPVTFTGAAVTSGTGTVSGTSGSGTNTVIVNLSGVTNDQRIVVSLLGVNDGTSQSSVGVPMGVLLGDTTGDATVNSADVSQTKSRSGQAVSTANFRSDVTADGNINSADISLVKAKSGTALP